jgi:hypothetical protein
LETIIFFFLQLRYRDGNYIIQGRETWCEMSLSGGGWELVAFAEGSASSPWPATNNDLKADSISSGVYDPEWVVKSMFKICVTRIVVIIVQVDNCSSFFFYCVLCNYTFQTNPNSVH